MPSTLSRVALAVDVPDALVACVSNAVGSVLAPAYGAFTTATADVIAPAENALDSFMPPSPLTADLPVTTVASAAFALLLYVVGMALCVLVAAVVRSKWQWASLAHNAAMMSLSAYMAVGIAVTAFDCGLAGWNNPVGSGPCARRHAKFVWLFYFSKALEFVDTFLMLLKGNHRQVTVLHVYHHVSVFAIWLLVTRWAPGGEAYFSSSLNSSVHVIMYTYYFLTALAPAGGSLRQSLQRHKHLITLTQMSQLSLNAVQGAYDVYVIPASELRYPRFLMQVLFWYMLTLLILFANFLVRDKLRVKSMEGRSQAAPSVQAPVADKPSQHQGTTSPRK